MDPRIVLLPRRLNTDARRGSGAAGRDDAHFTGPLSQRARQGAIIL